MAKGAKPARPISSYERAACPRGSHDCRIVFQIGEVEGYAVCAAFLRANEVKPAYDMVHGVGAFDALRGGLSLGDARDKARNRLIADDYHVEPPVIRDVDPEVERLLDEETPIVEPEPVQPEAPIGSIDSLIDARITHAVENGRAGVDPEQVRQIVADYAEGLTPNVTRYEYRERPPIEFPEGTAHEVVPKVVKLIDHGLQPWLYGPAGTGKSTIARQVAEILGSEFLAVQGSAMTDVTEFTGFVHAMGDAVVTDFEQCYAGDGRFSQGGTFLFDEADQVHPGVVKGLNAFFEGDAGKFASGMRKRSDGFVPIVAANTTAKGGDREYNGNVLDRSTLNRFRMIYVGYDHKLETAVADANHSEHGRTWRDLLWLMRVNQERYGVSAIISTRNMADIRLLDGSGMFSARDILDMGVFQGMESEKQDKLLANCDGLLASLSV